MQLLFWGSPSVNQPRLSTIRWCRSSRRPDFIDFKVKSGSGPGGQRFKSFRPDHFSVLVFFPTPTLTHTRLGSHCEVQPPGTKPCTDPADTIPVSEVN